MTFHEKIQLAVNTYEDSTFQTEKHLRGLYITSSFACIAVCGVSVPRVEPILDVNVLVICMYRIYILILYRYINFTICSCAIVVRSQIARARRCFSVAWRAEEFSPGRREFHVLPSAVVIVSGVLQVRERPNRTEWVGGFQRCALDGFGIVQGHLTGRPYTRPVGFHWVLFGWFWFV